MKILKDWCNDTAPRILFYFDVFTEKMHLSSVSEREKEASDRVQNISAMKESLEKQMEQHRQQHAKHLSDLREEVAEKQSLIDQLKE